MDYTQVYTKVFNIPSYSNDLHIQYDFCIQQLLKLFKPNDTFSVIDIGSGRGQVIQRIKQNFKNAIITSVDLKQFHQHTVDKFIAADLSKADDRAKLANQRVDVLICTDVLEHLDQVFIEEVIKTLSVISKKLILAIANHSDVQCGVELHTIQQNNQWWRKLLEKYMTIHEENILINGRLYEYFGTTNM